MRRTSCSRLQVRRARQVKRVPPQNARSTGFLGGDLYRLYPHRWFATRSFATTLPQGLYAALLTGLNNGAGLDLVEVYDLGQ